MFYNKYRACNTDFEAVHNDNVLQCDMKVSVIFCFECNYNTKNKVFLTNVKNTFMKY